MDHQKLKPYLPYLGVAALILCVLAAVTIPKPQKTVGAQSGCSTGSQAINNTAFNLGATCIQTITSVAAGTVTGLPAASGPTASVVNSAGVATVSFGIPAGAVGGTGIQGITGATGLTGSVGATGNIAFFNTAGAVTGIKCFIDTTTSTTTTGAFSFNMTSAGFASTPVIQLQTKSAGTNPNQVNTPALTTTTNTTVSGTVTSGTTLALLGATILTQPVGAVVSLTACGT